MKCCILMGSPRKNGNTAALLEPLCDELSKLGGELDIFQLQEMDIQPCIGCRTCQKDWTKFGCVHQDDVQRLFDGLLDSEIIIFATPIYSWYCTPQMKALLDRLVYGMNKYYGEEKGPSLWAGKKAAGLVTCGYPPEKGADLFQSGMERYCKHSKLQWMGMHVERHLGYDTVFMDKEKEVRVRQFATELYNT